LLDDRDRDNGCDCDCDCDCESDDSDDSDDIGCGLSVGVSFGFFPIMVPGITSSSNCGSTRLGFGGVVAICTLELPESHSAFIQ